MAKAKNSRDPNFRAWRDGLPENFSRIFSKKKTDSMLAVYNSFGDHAVAMKALADPKALTEVATNYASTGKIDNPYYNQNRPDYGTNKPATHAVDATGIFTSAQGTQFPRNELGIQNAIYRDGAINASDEEIQASIAEAESRLDRPVVLDMDRPIYEQRILEGNQELSRRGSVLGPSANAAMGGANYAYNPPPAVNTQSGGMGLNIPATADSTAAAPTLPTTVTPTQDGALTYATVQGEINRILKENNGVWTKELNPLVAQRDQLDPNQNAGGGSVPQATATAPALSNAGTSFANLSNEMNMMKTAQPPVPTWGSPMSTGSTTPPIFTSAPGQTFDNMIYQDDAPTKQGWWGKTKDWATTGDEQGVSRWEKMFGGTDDKGNRIYGGVGRTLGLAAGLANTWIGMENLQLAKDQHQTSKDQWQANYDQQMIDVKDARAQRAALGRA